MGPARRSFSLLATCRLRWELFLPPRLPPEAKIPCHNGLLSLWSHKPVKSSISCLDHEWPLRTEVEEEGFRHSCEVGGRGQGQAASADALILSAWDRESHQLQFPETYSDGDMCGYSCFLSAGLRVETVGAAPPLPPKTSDGQEARMAPRLLCILFVVVVYFFFSC